MTLEVEMPHPEMPGMKRKGRVYVCDLAGTEPAGDIVYALYEKKVSTGIQSAQKGACGVEFHMPIPVALKLSWSGMSDTALSKMARRSVYTRTVALVL